ncbi:zinc ribbon domain-containing protein [Haloferax sp. MBLA0076]|uniref:Zinc ribbon domain-containing protein n=1 Tax=Haloferax litoreum TaxID=2666140 RepID=A0A6A8GGQ5_9EURY|nr:MULTISPECIES: zinc ribbon domain-containing protein [Haloferax]KAB1193551.1 zinc ribbon domain-containing protein [Haloferax sp. CBA1148]MRX22066.1 zinc ribbon domain-containing protein [Haloferax litoreum]
MDIGLRLLVAGFCIVAPSLLFVGFVRVLDSMRNDALVERVLDRLDEDIDGTGTTVDPTTFLRTAQEKSREKMTTCPECSVPNTVESVRCGFCGTRLHR